MATTVEPREGAQPYVDADEYIDFQLAKTQSQIKTTEVLTSASWLGIAVLSYVLTFVILDQWVMPGGFSNWARAAWLGVLLCGGGGWMIARILIPWFRTIHELYAAKMIESADPTLKSSLLNLIDMQLHGKESLSPLVKVSMEKRAAVELSKVDVDHAVNHKALLRLAYVLLAVLVVCSLYVMLSPKDAFSSVQRLLLPASQTQVATRTMIANVAPEDTKVLAGELLTVEADILGQSPPQVTLVYTTADREFVNQPVDMQRLEDGVSRYRGVISGEKGRGLMQSISYRIEAGDARTRDYQVQVVEPPSSKVETVAYAFPSYMRLDAKTQLGGHIDGWEGTKVVVTAVTNIPVASALLVMTDSENPQAKGEEIRMTIRDGKTLTAEWTLGFRSDGTFARYYHIDCTTAAGESDPVPTVYAIKIQADQRPDVALLHPTQDLERPANAVVPLLVKAADPDFQLRFVTLRIEKGGEEIHSASLLDEERQTFEGFHDLKLDKLTATGLKPGDELLYWIEARDNKQPNGNRSTTPRLKIKISSPVKADEVAQQLEQDRERQQKELEQANPDRNPAGEEPREPEADPKADRPPPPKQQKPEPKPGEPKPTEDPANPDDPKPNEPEKPGQPQERPDKPEADPNKEPGQPAEKPQQKPGNKAEPKQGEQKPGEGGGEKSANGQKGTQKKPTGNEAESSNEPGENGEPSSKPRKKKGPADDQSALSKLLQREQEAGGSNPDEPEKNPQSENDPDQQPGQGEQEKPGTGKSPKKPGERPMPSRTKNDTEKNDPGKTEKSDSDATQEKPEKSNSKKGTDKTKSEENQPDNTGRNKPAGTNKKDENGGTEKQKSGTEKTAGERPMPNDGSQTGKAEKPATKSDNSKENDPNAKSMKKDATGNPEPGQPKEKAEEKSTDNESEKNANGTSKSGTTAKKPGEKDPMADDPMNKSAKSANKQPGQAAEEGGKENSPEQKGTGTGKKSAQQRPDESDPTQKGPGTGQKPGPKKDTGSEKPKLGAEESPEKQPGEETPAEEGSDAVKKKATGDEKGPATGQEKPDGEKAPKAKNDLERDPKSKPGAMRKSDDPREAGTKKEVGSKDPDATKAKPDGSERLEEPMKGTNKKSGQPPEKRPGSDPSQDEPNPGPGQKNQKSKQADTGEGGGNTPQDQGTPGSKQKGTGDTQKKPGNQTPANKQQGGEPGKKPGEGSKTQPTDKASDKSEQGPGEKGKSEGAEDKPGAGEPMPGEGQGGEPKPGAGEPGKGGQPKGAPPKGAQPPKGGQPGQGGKAGANPGDVGGNPDQPDDQAGNGPGEPNGERKNLPPAEQDQAAQEAEEKANEEFARKASNLVLKKLRKELERGEVDQKLLDELGWTKEDMEQFVKRLEQQLEDTGNDTSPEAAARRRQFEETLKALGLRLNGKTTRRAAGSGKTTRVNEIGTRKVAPPPEYQELFEEYTKELSKPTTPGKK